MAHGKRLKDIYKDIDGGIISESKEIITKDDSMKSQKTVSSESDITGTGLGIHTSNPIGSSAVTMQIDLPGIIALNQQIGEQMGNVKNMKKFVKNILNIQKNYRGLSKGGAQREAAKKLIESARKARKKW